MSLLDLDESLVDILNQVELTVSPLTDIKDFAFHDIDVGIVEGGIGNIEHREVARKLRKHSKILAAWGDCAVFGGINTLRNGIPTAEVLKYGFIESQSTVDGRMPIHEELPALLDHVLPLDYVVPVDVYVPGCPPAPEALAYSLTEILAGRIPVIPADMIHFD